MNATNSDSSIWEKNSFSIFLSTFPKSTLKFEYFQRKDDPHSLCISEITDSEKGD